MKSSFIFFEAVLFINFKFFRILEKILQNFFLSKEKIIIRHFFGEDGTMTFTITTFGIMACNISVSKLWQHMYKQRFARLNVVLVNVSAQQKNIFDLLFDKRKMKTFFLSRTHSHPHFPSLTHTLSLAFSHYHNFPFFCMNDNIFWKYLLFQFCPFTSEASKIAFIKILHILFKIRVTSCLY